MNNSEARKRADHSDAVRDLYNARTIRDYRRDPHNDRVGEVAYIVWVKEPE